MALLILSDNSTAKAIQAKLRTPSFLWNPLRIVPLEFNPTLLTLPEKIIVTSPNAAAFGFKKIVSLLKKETLVFTIGESTAETLQPCWPSPIQHPETFTSEALLELADLQNVAKQNILLIKGKGGRTLLEESLRARGADIQILECYERLPQMIDLTENLKIWQNNRVQTLLVSSAESLEAFLTFIPDKPWAKSLSLLVTSERLKAFAETKWFKNISVAKNFTAEAVLAALKKRDLT